MLRATFRAHSASHVTRPSYLERTMRRFLVVLFVSLLLPGAVMAQDETPKATIFGGYSLLRNGGNNSNGWDGQGTFNFNRYLGLTADVTGNYRTLASFSPLSVVSSSA